MCIILGMYTRQLKNGEAVVTQTTWVSARAHTLRLLHSRNKHDNSHYKLYKIINTITIEYGLYVIFLRWNANLCSDIKGYK